MRVLVVDDESNVRFALRWLLEHAGHDVAEAGDGAAALARVADCPTDLVVTDVMMPVMGGRELIARLRSDPATASMPIIVLSAERDIESLPVAAVLAKPFGNADLLESVRAVERGRE